MLRRAPLLWLALTLPAFAEAPARLADLAFLTGRWEGELTLVRAGQPGPDGPQRYETSYSTPDGGRLLSASKALEPDGSCGFWEFELFRERDGRVVLTPLPGGRPAGEFALSALDRAALRATFERSGEDWPQRIVYERAAADRLTIVASGQDGGAPLELRVALRRVE